MDFSALLEKRRSIRDFTGQDVPRDLILELMKESTLAPSSYNNQPWRFIVVRDRAFIKRISDECKKNNLARLEREPDSVLIRDRDDLLDENYNVFYNAPVVVFVAGPAHAPSLDVDCALWAAYFMLAAVNRGLGTCWVGLGTNISDPALLAEMGLPDGFRIIAPIILGWPRTIPAPSERKVPEILKEI